MTRRSYPSRRSGRSVFRPPSRVYWLRRPVTTGVAAAAPSVAEIGTSPLGLAATATEVKVAAVTGSATTGLAATGTSRKVAAVTGTATLGLAPSGLVAGDLISTLVDMFTTADTALWNFSAGVNVTGGQLEVPCTSSYLDAATDNAYTLTGSGLFLQVTGVPAVGNGSTETYVALVAPNNDSLRFIITNGEIRSIRVVGGSPTTIDTATYSGTTHKWVRISESGGTVTWATSPDSTNWTTFSTWSHGGAIDLTQLTVKLISGYWGTETTPGNATFDNVNVPSRAAAGRVTVGLDGAGAGKKAAAPAGVATVGLVGTRAGAVSRAVLGATALGLIGASVDRKVAVGVGQTDAALVGAGADAKLGRSLGVVTVGFAPTAAPSKLTPETGLATLGLVGAGSISTWGPPTNLQATPVSQTQIDLSWNSVAEASGYDIERDGIVIITDVVGTSYSDTGLTPGTTYEYRARSVRA